MECRRELDAGKAVRPAGDIELGALGSGLWTVGFGSG